MGKFRRSGQCELGIREERFNQVPKKDVNEEDLVLKAIDAGADDFKVEDEYYEIYTPFESLHKVRSTLEQQGIKIENAELTMVPQNTVELDGKQAEQMLKLMNALEDHDDVQNVFANFDIDVELMEKMQT